METSQKANDQPGVTDQMGRQRKENHVLHEKKWNMAEQEMRREYATT